MRSRSRMDCCQCLIPKYSVHQRNSRTRNCSQSSSASAHSTLPSNDFTEYTTSVQTAPNRTDNPNARTSRLSQLRCFCNKDRHTGRSRKLAPNAVLQQTAWFHNSRLLWEGRTTVSRMSTKKPVHPKACNSPKEGDPNSSR